MGIYAKVVVYTPKYSIHRALTTNIYTPFILPLWAKKLNRFISRRIPQEVSDVLREQSVKAFFLIFIKKMIDQ